MMAGLLVFQPFVVNPASGGLSPYLFGSCSQGCAIMPVYFDQHRLILNNLG